MPRYVDPDQELGDIDARLVRRWRDAAARHDPLGGSRQEITERVIRDLTFLTHVAIEDDEGVLPEHLYDIATAFHVIAKTLMRDAPDADDRIRHELHAHVDSTLADDGLIDDSRS